MPFRRLAVPLLVALAWDARAVTLAPVTLPGAEPTAASLLASPAELAALQARRAVPPFQAHFQATRSFVDGRLAALASNAAAQGDDTLSKVAKAAGLLHFLGETPPSSFATYAEVVVRAIRNVKPRDPGNPVFPPANAVDVLQDSSRLQSMVEGYDFVRASLSSGDDGALRGVIADWAEALRNDLNLAGAFGVAGHRDNWGIKAGAVLVECALAMPRHSNAAQWLAFGRTLLSESLDKVSDAHGWFRESPHYLNYSLANLFTAAVAVRNRTGADWFAGLAPFARLALDMRQPDGWSMPFEEGVATTFPYDVFASRLTDLGPQLQWAWTNSPKDATNFENQAFHAVTRFLFTSDVAAEPPGAPATRFADGPAHVHVLRSGWDADAVQLTAITALDHSSSTNFASRHNMQNPLDFTLFSHRRIVVATSGGGPTVTSSANRDTYLRASSRNVPLLAGAAPFIVDESKVRSDARLDSTWADGARTTVTAYPGATVRRTWLLLDGAEAFVADEVDASSAVDVALPVHPRGTRTMRSSGPAVDGTWSVGDTRLDLFATGTPDLSAANTASFTSPTWGVEEAVQGIELRVRSASARSLVRLAARSEGAAAPAVERLQATSGAALRVTRPSGTDLVASGAGSAEGVAFDGALVVVRRTADALAGLVAVAARSVTIDGVAVLSAPAPVTFAATFTQDGLLLTTTRDAPDGLSFVLSGVLPEGGWAMQGAGGTFSQAGRSLSFASIPADTTVSVGPGRPPVLTVASTHAAREGELLRIEPAVSDPDGTVTVTVEGLPSAATLDAATGTVTWTPGYDLSSRSEDASIPLVFKASDGFHEVSAATTVVVANVNRRPSLAPDSTVTVTRGEEAVVELQASDPDGDGLSFTVREAEEVTPAPEVSGTPAALRWTPGATVPVGTWAVEVEASDGELSAATTVAFRVVEAERPDAGGDGPDAGEAESTDGGGDGPGVPGGCGCGATSSAGALALLALRRRRRG